MQKHFSEYHDGQFCTKTLPQNDSSRNKSVRVFHLDVLLRWFLCGILESFGASLNCHLVCSARTMQLGAGSELGRNL
eukprot:08966_3